MSDVVPAGIIMIGVRDSGIEKDADQILNPSHDKEKPNRPTRLNIKERQVSDYSNISEN